MTQTDMLFFALCAMLILTLLALTVYAFIKRKARIIAAMAATVLCIAALFALFPTQFPYADIWIIGKTREQITALYGEPTGYDQAGMISYQLGKDHGFFGIMSSNNDVHYYIYFDSQGKACKILEGCQLGG